MNSKWWIGLWMCGWLLVGCDRSPIADIAPQSAPGLINVVITTPAGTNQLQAIDRTSGSIQAVMEQGRPVTFPFAVVPGNWGIVPGTRRENGGGTGPVEVLVLAETVPVGAVQEVVPLGLLKYTLDKHLHHLVVAVPALEADRLSSVVKREDMSGDLVFFLELWLLNHRGPGRVTLYGWKNEAAALDFVRSAIPAS